MRAALMIVIALTVALFAVVPAVAIPKIERDLASRAAAALKGTGQDWATVRANGLSISIEGEAPTAAIRDSAIQAIASVQGIRAVEDRTTLAPPRDYQLRVSREADGLVLRGEVPDADVESAILTAISQVAPTMSVDTELTVAPGAPPGNWRNMAISAGEQAARLFSGQAVLAGDDLVIAGTVLDQPTLDLIRSTLAEREVAAATVDVSVLTPRLYELKLSRSGDRLDISGEAPDEDSRDALVALAERQDVLIVNSDGFTIARGVATENWHVLTSALIRHVSAMQEAEAHLQPGHLDLSGTVPDSAMADLVRTAITSVFDNSGLDLDIDIHAPSAASDDADSIMADLTDTQALLDYADAAEIPPIDPDHLLGAADCQSTLNSLVTDDRIRFVDGSADLDPASRHLLEAIALTIRRCSDVLIEVSGHTESGDDSAKMEALSTAMANAVVDYLGRRGVDTDIMVATGYGDMVPIADNATEEGRARNHRIEFLVAPDR